MYDPPCLLSLETRSNYFPGASVPPQQRTVWIALFAMLSTRGSCQDLAIWQTRERLLEGEVSLLQKLLRLQMVCHSEPRGW